MIDLIINAVRVVISEDARKSASALIDLIRHSPEWQKDIATLEARIERASSEIAYLLGEMTVVKMGNLNYSLYSMSALRTSYSELVTNAFEYGCDANPHAAIGVNIEITPHFVGVTVLNQKGKKFDLIRAIERQSAALSHDTSVQKGRGLLLVRELSDTLEETHNKEGVKTVFYKPSVNLQATQIEDLAILTVVDGLTNPSASRRIYEL